MTKDIVLVTMNALSGSGQTGKTTLSDINGKTKVIVEISGGAVDVSHNHHISTWVQALRQEQSYIL